MSAQINARFADEETELSDSLSRSGKGSMLVPLRVPDGTVAAPAVAFTSEPGSGLYKAGTGDVRLAVGGVDALKLVSGSLGDTVAMAAAANVSTLKTVGTDSALLLQGNRASASTSPEVAVGSTAARTAGDIFAVQNQIGITNVLFVDYQGLLRLASQAAAIQPASIWTAITPGAGWTAGGGLGFWKSSDGIVYLKGNITGALGSSIFTTLPAGFRPASARIFSVPWSGTAPPAANDGFYFVQVSSNGIITAPVNSAGTIWYLDGINFLAEA